MRTKVIFAGLSLLATLGCSKDPSGPTAEVISLTAAQAAGVVNQVAAFASDDPLLAALADTIGVVVNAGAEARRIQVTTDLGSDTYYALSLHRTIAAGASTSSTFHVIAFDDPSNPRRFIILGGWKSPSSSSVSGPIGAGGTSSLTAHLFSVSGGALSSWHASAGSVTLIWMESLQQCASTAPPNCIRGSMDAQFAITATVPGNGTTGSRTASGTITGAPGIRLAYTP